MGQIQLRCATCLYVESVSIEGRFTAYECHRYPPKTTKTGASGIQEVTYPHVDLETHWCAEHTDLDT